MEVDLEGSDEVCMLFTDPEAAYEAHRLQVLKFDEESLRLYGVPSLKSQVADLATSVVQVVKEHGAWSILGAAAGLLVPRRARPRLSINGVQTFMARSRVEEILGRPVPSSEGDHVTYGQRAMLTHVSYGVNKEGVEVVWIIEGAHLERGGRPVFEHEFASLGAIPLPGFEKTFSGRCYRFGNGHDMDYAVVLEAGRSYKIVNLFTKMLSAP